VETSFPRVLPHERRTTILWANLPVTAVWLIGLLLGINLISVGTAIAYLAWHVRKTWFRSTRRTLERRSAKTDAPYCVPVLCLRGRSIKNGPLMAQPLLSTPDQIEGLLRTNGRSQFLLTLAAAMANNSGGFSPPLSTCLLPLRPAASPPKPPNNLCARQCPDELAHRLSLLLVPDLGNVADDIEQHTLV